MIITDLDAPPPYSLMEADRLMSEPVADLDEVFFNLRAARLAIGRLTGMIKGLVVLPNPGAYSLDFGFDVSMPFSQFAKVSGSEITRVARDVMNQAARDYVPIDQIKKVALHRPIPEASRLALGVIQEYEQSMVAYGAPTAVQFACRRLGCPLPSDNPPLHHIKLIVETKRDGSVYRSCTDTP